MTDESTLRSMHARIAALTRAATTDGAEISAPARAAFLARFESGHTCKLCGTVTIDPDLPADQRRRAADAARKLHFTRLAMRPRTARARAARLLAVAEQDERQLATELAELDDAS